jgi:hypothetical protein
MPLEAWMFCLAECFMFSGRGGFWVGLITRPEESYRLWSVQWLRWHSPVMDGHDPESGRKTKKGGGGNLKKYLRIPIKSSWRTILFRRQRASNKLLNPINELCVSVSSLALILKTLTARLSQTSIWKTCHWCTIHLSWRVLYLSPINILVFQDLRSDI